MANFPTLRRTSASYFPLVMILLMLTCSNARAQGPWTALTDTSLDYNAGVMLLLTDGSVICLSVSESDSTGVGRLWNKLTPDSTGHYANGTWSRIAPMNDTRLYCSSQVLRSGRVYIAGGEYGSGDSTAEIYDPIADTWTHVPGIPQGFYLDDANSMMLPDGRILDNSVYNPFYNSSNLIYDPVTDSLSYNAAATCIGDADETIWTLQPDNSILFIDNNNFYYGDSSTERYIPALGRWIPDANVPVAIYDTFEGECGGSALLPDGRSFFLGSTGNTAIYTPSGNTTPGSWVAGPVIPDGNGTPDAPAAMMADGNILFAASTAPFSMNPDSQYLGPSYFYEYHYLQNTMVPVIAPGGGDSADYPPYAFQMLDLPDGTVLFVGQGYNQYYIYTPSGPPVASGRPTISAVTQDSCTFMITGTLFNGISQGASYGDDWQMATNYPIVSIAAGGRVYYARTTNWNRYAVQTGALPDTAYFTLPWSVPNGNYSLYVSANGISSDGFAFAYTSCTTGIKNITASQSSLSVRPNPAHGEATLTFTTDDAGSYTIQLTDLCGRVMLSDQRIATPGTNDYTLPLTGLDRGIYIATVIQDNHSSTVKVAVE